MSTDVLIFSKDRACQLDLLLSSLEERITNIGSVSVLYKCSSANFIAGYKLCISQHTTVNFIEESDFQLQVKGWLNDMRRSPTVMFAVDDDLFRDHINFSEISQLLQSNPQVICYSPKLGLQLSYCYSLNMPQPIPNGNVHNGYFIWDWRNSIHDWQYVFSVAGNVFRTAELAAWVNGLHFSAPNNFEDAIQQIKNYFVVPQIAICNVVSKMINMPINRVQDTHKNRCGNVSHIDLNERYLNGERIDPVHYYKVLPRACHEDIPIVWRNS